jgi:hypothetical protein
VKHREAKAVISVGPWPEALDMDAAGLSAYLKNAFAKVFAKTQHLADDDNSRIGITYSGHGGTADGSLFAGVVNAADAVSLLQGLVHARSKFSMFNFGTNCQEGRWNMLASMHPFADHILASDLNVGGLEKSNPQDEIKHVKAKAKLDDVVIIKLAAEKRQPIEKMVSDIIEKRRELWLGAMKKAITKQRLRQSIAAFETSKFPGFASSLKAAYQELPMAQQEEVKARAEASECDVLTVVHYMDSAVVESNLLQEDNGTGLTSNSSDIGSLEKSFLALRSDYASTQSLFKWTPATYGLGFNFLGSKDHDSRCDLEAAFGKLACGPVCKQKALKAKEKKEAARIKHQKQEELFRKEMKKVLRDHDEQESKRRAKMSDAEKAREAREEKRDHEIMAKQIAEDE